ncbi:MAG TPA: hypothetical protein VMV44_15635 [Rectinemataceae bacterium]|nr:hypothetical protein [Rectinemataceae bacterium]
MTDNPIILKWFEVTWVTASGRTLVRAEDEGEARMIASQNTESDMAETFAGRSALPLPEGKLVLNQWFDTTDPSNEPMIFDVEELANDMAAELKRDMEEG